MINRAFEWFASRHNPRFKHYRQARLAYEACMPEIGKPFEDLEPGDYEKWRRDARLVAAAAHYRVAIELCRQENTLGDLATALYQLGMLFHLQGQLNEANECIQASLQQQDGFPQSNRELQTLRSGCLYHLGVMAMKLGHFAAAREHLRTSLEIDEALDDFRGAMMSRRALEKCELLCPQESPASDDAAPTETSGESTTASPGSPPRGSDDATPFQSQPPQSPRQQGSPRRVRRHRRPSLDDDVVWLFSCSIAANDIVMELFEQYRNDFPRRTAFSRVAFGSENPNRTSPDPITPGSRLCAAVLVVEPGALDNEEFRHWTRWCITAVADRDDFRLFVRLHDMTMEEIIHIANRRHHPSNAQEASDPAGALADELINTVQIADGASAAEMVDALISYLCDRDDICAAARWRATMRAASAYLGRAALAVEVVCCAALVGGAIAWLGVEKFGWDAGWRLLGHLEPGVLAMVFGVPMFALQTIPLFFLSKGTAASQAILREDPRLVWWFCGGAFLCPATIVIPTQLGATAPMIALGIVAGTLFDALRRNGLQARRARVSLERAYDSVGRGAGEFVARALVRPQSLHPLTCPLFPAESPAVFISYRRHSEWSAGVAAWLHSELRKNYIPSSLDRESIGEGSSWRRALNRFISETQVFLVLVDERSLASRWMAAEAITALAGRRLTRQPEIIVLVEPSFSISPQRDGWAVFHALLDEATKPTNPAGIRLIRATEFNARTLASQLTSHHLTTISLFSPRAVTLLKLFAVPLTAIGTAGAMLGVPALFFAWLQQLDKVDSAAFLAHRRLLPAAVLTAGYLCGYAARLAVASRYEVRHDEPRSLAMLNSVATAGFGWLAMAWAVEAPGVVTGWGIALGCLGWLMAACFISGVSRAKGDFLRDVR